MPVKETRNKCHKQASSVHALQAVNDIYSAYHQYSPNVRVQYVQTIQFFFHSFLPSVFFFSFFSVFLSSLIFILTFPSLHYVSFQSISFPPLPFFLSHSFLISFYFPPSTSLVSLSLFLHFSFLQSFCTNSLFLYVYFISPLFSCVNSFFSLSFFVSSPFIYSLPLSLPLTPSLPHISPTPPPLFLYSYSELGGKIVPNMNIDKMSAI